MSIEERRLCINKLGLSIEDLCLSINKHGLCIEERRLSIEDLRLSIEDLRLSIEVCALQSLIGGRSYEESADYQRISLKRSKNDSWVVGQGGNVTPRHKVLKPPGKNHLSFAPWYRCVLALKPFVFQYTSPSTASSCAAAWISELFTFAA